MLDKYTFIPEDCRQSIAEQVGKLQSGVQRSRERAELLPRVLPLRGFEILLSVLPALSMLGKCQQSIAEGAGCNTTVLFIKSELMLGLSACMRQQGATLCLLPDSTYHW